MKTLKQVVQAVVYLFAGLFALVLVVAVCDVASEQRGGKGEPEATAEHSATEEPAEPSDAAQPAEEEPAEPEEEPPEEPSPPALVAGEAAVTTGEGIACQTAEKLDEARAAAEGGDYVGFKHLINTHVCIAPKKGIRASVLERSAWEGWIKVRLYSDEITMEYFAMPEALERASE